MSFEEEHLNSLQVQALRKKNQFVGALRESIEDKNREILEFKD